MEHGSVASRPYLGSRREPAPRRWQQMELCGTELARELLVRGFCFEGQRVPLVAPQGIFKPAVLPELPLSITTALRQRDFRERVLLAYQVGCSICLLRQRDVQRGPADALRVRRRAPAPTDPGAFCAALLGPLRYVLPADVDEGTWQLALRHFARTRPNEQDFRRLLEQRAGRGGPARGGDAGARVAAVLLREWERYGLARLLGAGRSAGGRGRGSWPAPRSAGVPDTASRSVRLPTGSQAGLSPGEVKLGHAVDRPTRRRSAGKPGTNRLARSTG